MNEFALAIIFIGFLFAVVLAWYFYIKAKSKERIALIESGRNSADSDLVKAKSSNIPWLKLGIILIGFSLGLIINFLTIELFLKDALFAINTAPATFGIVFLFTAISIIVAYFADKPKN